MAHWASSMYTGVGALPVRNACRWTNNLLWLNDFDLDDAIAHTTHGSYAHEDRRLCLFCRVTH